MKYDDVKTSVDCRYLAMRDLDGMAWVNAWRRRKRRGRRFVAWLRSRR